jgi:hypothetical protein
LFGCGDEEEEKSKKKKVKRKKKKIRDHPRSEICVIRVPFSPQIVRKKEVKSVALSVAEV